MKKSIAIDLGGTTLNVQSLISPRTEQTLKKAIDNGHYVSIATGCPYRMSHQFCQQLGLTTPMVSFNGALVHIPEKKWDLEDEANIERDPVFDILAQKEGLQLDFVAAENKETFHIDTLDGFNPKFLASKAILDNLLTAKNLRTNPTSMMVRTTPNQAEKVADTLTGQYGDCIDVRTWGGPMSILEMVAKGIQKTRGVDQVANFLSVKPADIITFGDEHNDGEMSSYAGWDVTMNNVMDKIKSVANDATEKTNDQDGLADYLENYLDLQKAKIKVFL